MYRYIDDFNLEDDETFQKILLCLNQLNQNMTLKNDKDLLSLMVKEAYLKHRLSIKAKSGSDTELMLSVVMSLLIEQSNDVERLSSIIK
ncbi:MAG TPA: hypothetical protein VJR94_01940 [Candidatus Nitrosocosmicus sp.]|nr:hypothetical protein [Candidatus Nitrosocosmicus sp.]